MINNVVVLGFTHPTALGILRCLRVLKRKNVKIWAIGNKDQMGGAFYSNIPYNKIVYHKDIGLIDYLKKIRNIFDDDPALFMTTDQQAVEISENREELECRYKLLLPDKDILNIFMQKTKFQNLAESNKWPVPRSVKISSENMLSNICNYMHYPFVVKPYLVHSRLIKSESELEKYIAELNPINYKSMIVQEWVNGTDSDIYFNLTLSNRNNEMIASVSARKIRQYPSLYGTVTSCYSEDNGDTEKITRKILDSVNIEGYCGFEYKYDKRKQKYYIMEPTIGRLDSQIALTYAAGINLPLLMYEILNGNNRPVVNKQKNNILWIDEHRERKILKECNESKYWYLSKLNRIYVLFDIRDPVPYLKYYIDRKIKIFTKINKRLIRLMKDINKFFKKNRILRAQLF